MKKISGFFLGAIAWGSVACGNAETTTSTTDRSPATETSAEGSTEVESPTSATSSAGGGGMSGATNSHALAADTLARDSAQ